MRFTCDLAKCLFTYRGVSLGVYKKRLRVGSANRERLLWCDWLLPPVLSIDGHAQGEFTYIQYQSPPSQSATVFMSLFKSKFEADSSVHTHMGVSKLLKIERYIWALIAENRLKAVSVVKLILSHASVSRAFRLCSKCRTWTSILFIGLRAINSFFLLIYSFYCWFISKISTFKWYKIKAK